MYAARVGVLGTFGLLMALALERGTPALAVCPQPEVAAVPELPAFALDPLLAQAWVGSVSLGKPTRGALVFGVALEAGPDIERAGGYPWGTAETVRSIRRAAQAVRRCFPRSPRLVVGDLSREHGGFLSPHRSHQSGLDADLGYFFKGPSVWYQRATPKTLDVARTYALVRALIAGGDVDTIFIDASLQRALKSYGESLPEALRPGPDWFQTPTRKDTLIRHAWGHATHLHVRFRPKPAREE